MLIRLESRLKSIKEDLKDKVPKEEIPMRGTLVVIDGKMDFQKTDGYIQFLKLAMNNISVAYGEQVKEWQQRIRRICNMAEKLCDANTRFTGNTKEEFTVYCQKVSHILDMDLKVSVSTLSFVTEKGDLVSFMEKQIEKGNNLGFYYEESEDSRTMLMEDLMELLSELKMEKHQRMFEPSYYLYDSGYHEHIHDALNLLIQAGVYVINCSSTEGRSAYGFDIMEIDNRLAGIESIIRRVEHLPKG